MSTKLYTKFLFTHNICNIDRLDQLREDCPEIFDMGHPKQLPKRPNSTDPNISYMAYQLEVGANNNLHWQGYVELQVGVRKSTLGLHKMLWWDYPIKRPQNLFCHSTSCHYTAVYTNNGASLYPLKEDTCFDIASRYLKGTPRDTATKTKRKRDDESDAIAEATVSIRKCKTWKDVLDLNCPQVASKIGWAKEVFNNRKRFIPKCVLKLREWQMTVYNKLFNLTNRQILFVIDYEGGNGKTEFCKWMRSNYKDNLFLCNGGNTNTNDIAYAYQCEPLAIFDFPRASNPQEWPYSLMESMKDGCVFSPKYTSCTKEMNPVKILVFSNREPVWERFTRDRWESTTVYLNNAPSTNHIIMPEMSHPTAISALAPIIYDLDEEDIEPTVQCQEESPELDSVDRLLLGVD